MKILSQTNSSAAKDTTGTAPPIKVCMHVLEVARTDGRVMREATALLEAGFAVSIVDVESERSRPIEEEICGIRVKHILMPSWFLSKRSRLWSFVEALQVRICSILRLMQTPADIYHAHDVMALPTCYIVARLHRKPLIFDAHELILPERESPHWQWVRSLLEYFLVSILPHCAGVITVSPSIAREISNHYHVPKVSLIRNIPVYQTVQKSDRLQQYLGLNPDTRIALYQGNLQPDRELDKLIRAAAFLNHDNVIVLMGKGVGTTPSQLETLIFSEGAADRVKILLPVPYAELLDWTTSADIGLIVYSPDHSLNVRMCLPNKLFEYLMAGLPVLASPLDAVTDVINSYDVGRVVPSLAPADIGAAINAMLADHDALASMRCNALGAAKQDLNWEKESQQLLRLYHDIMATANGRG